MTCRDLRWKAGGLALTGLACTLCLVLDTSPWQMLLFPLALLGLPLMIHGKRVGQMVRAERRGHAHTADLVHAARLRRHAEGRGLSGR
jgi:hypothetical protein